MPTGQAAKLAHIRPAGTAGARGATPARRSLPRGLVPRPELARRLTDARDKPLALMVAPPGYGKSTLLGEWAQRDGRPFVWPTATRGWLELTELIRSACARYPRFVLVIDSADELQPEVLSEIVPAAMNDLPADSTIALALRTEPQLPLGRLRAHRVVVELRIADLAMTTAEADTLLAREGVDLPPEDVKTLVGHTEGWPAALYLAALWLREAPDDLASFGGGQHSMFEYLKDEVFMYLPAGLNRFAIRTSVLDELSGPLCDAVLGQRGSGVLLAELARLSPLLGPVDPSRHRYRWHGLVREALRSELHRVEPELEPELQRRASVWYSDCGETSRAIDHAAASGDAELTGDLLCEHLVAFLTRGSRKTVDEWLSAFVSDRVAEYAPLALSASLSALVAGNLDEAQRWSVAARAAAERGRAGKHRGSLAAGLKLVQAMASRTGVGAMGELARSAAAGEPPDSQWRPVSLLLSAVSAHLEGDPRTAAEILDESIAVTGDSAPTITALCLAQRGMIAIEEQEWDLVAEVTDRAAMIVEEWGLANDPISALVFAVAAASRAHHGRVDEAKAAVRRGVDLLATLGDFPPWYGAEARILLAHASLWLADVVRARTLLAEASRLARKTPGAARFGRWFDEAWAYMDTLAETRLAGPSSLTIAELRILRFLPSHRSFREIAGQLNVSANTVKTQAHAVYRKLGAASRSEAVAKALDAGLLS
jgi:LuxR family maltose regulon positive regulatory protein